MSNGRFITFEGVDGAGKSTQVAALAQALGRHGRSYVQTREPGGTPLGEALRTLALGQDMLPMTETLLMFAARGEHVFQVIAPALAAGQWVLCDRFLDASYAYQGAGRGVAAERLAVLGSWLPTDLQSDLRPDLTVLVDIDPAEAQRRRAAARTADRFEQESLAFFERVRAGYRARAAQDPARFLVLDGAAPAGAMAQAVWERVVPWLR
jgi:dTMP kinase